MKLCLCYYYCIPHSTNLPPPPLYLVLIPILNIQWMTSDISFCNNNTYLWCLLYIVFSSYQSLRTVA